MIYPRYLLGLLLVTAFAVTISIFTTPGGNYSYLINSFSIGIVVSTIFYLLVIYLPELRRRRVVTRAFAKQFDSFRKNCIDTFLILSKSQEYKNRENLLLHEEFRRYFKNNNGHGEDRWFAVANSLQENRYYLDEIIFELQRLNDEIKYIKNTIYLFDSEVFDFLNRLSQIIHRYERTEQEYDSIKSFMGFLWTIFTGWNWADGYKNAEYLEKMISRVK